MFYSLLIFLLTSLPAFANATHKCQVNASIDIYDPLTMRWMGSTPVHSDWFEVTSATHQLPRTLDLLSESSSSKMGEARVWTGILLGTPQGDVIQAHADFTVDGLRDEVNLFFSPDTGFAKSVVTVSRLEPFDYTIIPTELVCVRK